MSEKLVDSLISIFTLIIGFTCFIILLNYDIDYGIVMVISVFLLWKPRWQNFR